MTKKQSENSVLFKQSSVYSSNMPNMDMCSHKKLYKPVQAEQQYQKTNCTFV